MYTPNPFIHELGIELPGISDPVKFEILNAFLYSNLNVIERTYYSGWAYYTADGGLISNPYDMVVFMKELMTGELLQPAALTSMLTWKSPKESDPKFYPIQYGLVFFRIETPQVEVYMRSGDAIGYYANVLYLPEQNTTICYAANGNY